MPIESGVNDLVATAKEEFGGMKHLAHDAFTSKAYLYPAKGIFYFLNHPDLWRPLFLRLGPSIATACVITILMFFFTYFPQVFIFGIFNGPLALVNVFFLVLSESAAISGAITKSMYLERGLSDIFDATLIEKGSGDLVHKGRKLKGGGNVWQRMGHKAKAPWPKFSPNNVISYLMYMPLNFIPVVGTLIFLYLQGKKYGPPMHNRYFQLKGMDSVSKDAAVEGMRGAYTAFGVPAAMLEHLTAFTGIFFAYTNTVGAALWAHDMENHLLPDQELQDLKKKTDATRKQLEEQLKNSMRTFEIEDPNFEGNAKEIADKLAGDIHKQLEGTLVGQVGNDLQAQLDHSALGQAAQNLQAQIDHSAVGQVAQNLQAQTDALAAGAAKGLPHHQQHH